MASNGFKGGKSWQEALEDLMNQAFNDASEQMSSGQNQYFNYAQYRQQHLPPLRPKASFGVGAFRVLGLEPGATQDEIKKAYRKKAMEHHPDRGGDPAKFNEVQLAYESLAG